MAIRTNKSPESAFTDGESAIKALDSLFDGTAITRGGMYLLQIINNLIDNDQKEIYQRLPQGVFGGLPEGGRRNVQASVICRAKGTADAAQQCPVQESGYTEIQEIIGQWAERDGCWSDTPEADLTSKGRRHRDDLDGSEARVFYDDGAYIHKTIDFLRYDSMARFFDRIAIHNAYFPETAMQVVGFGMRDYSDDNTGFCAVISQPFVKGDVPTEEEIDAALLQRGLVYPQRGVGFYFISPGHDTLLTDLHDKNCVKLDDGKVVFFDCEAIVNDIPGFEGRFKIPELQYNPDSVRTIISEINRNLPVEMPLETLIDTLPKETRIEARRALLATSRLGCPVPGDGPYAGSLVQTVPEDPHTVLVSPKRSAEFLLSFGTVRPDDGKTPFSADEKDLLSEGRTVYKEGKWYSLDLDKGRPVCVTQFNAMRLMHEREVTQQTRMKL